MENRNRLQIINDLLYRQYSDHTGKPVSKQFAVPDSITDDIIRTLLENPMQGHPGASEMLKVLRSRYYAPN